MPMRAIQTGRQGRAVEGVDELVRTSVAAGAGVALGGGTHELGGLFYQPTILTEVNPEMSVFRNEIFGPVAPVITFSEEDDVLSMANDTSYGLAAYIYTQNLSRAVRTFEGLQFGIVGINDINPTSAAAPFGGMKESGLGREGAREGIEEYLETKLGGFSI